MSSRWSVRTSGAPYLGFLQNDLTGMTPDGLFSGLGPASIELDFALHAMPQQLASGEEVHMLFSLYDAIVPNTTLLGIGVTPSGRAIGITPDGTGPFTSINRVRADGVFHHVVLVFDSGTGDTRFTIDSDAQINGSAANIPAVPSALARFGLFLGTSALTRCAASISRAYALGIDGFGPAEAIWNIDETEGSVVRATKSGTGWNAHNLDLTAQYAGAVSGAQPWALSIPIENPSQDYYWKLATPWVKDVAKRTKWHREKVTWPT